MKLGEVLALTGLGLFGIWAYKKYNAIKLLQVRFQSISFGSNINSGTVILNLTNPSSESLSIDSLTGYITDSAGNELAQIVNSTPVTITAQTSVNYPVNFYVSLTNALQTALSALTAVSLPNLYFKGNVLFEGISIPVNQLALPV